MLDLQLVYIILCGDTEELFFSYVCNIEKSKVLYSAAKNRVPNAIISKCFKKHFHEIMNERQHNGESSGLFFYLPSITDQKEIMNQYRDNVNLNPIDCSLGFLSSFSPDKVDFNPHLLNSGGAELRNSQVELLYNFYKQRTETSNVSLIGNADYLLAFRKQDKTKIVRVNPIKQRCDTTKFKLTYYFF